MKKLFFGILAMAAFAACSNEEPIAIDKTPIAFSNAFVNNSVRAIDNTFGVGAVFNSFNVYGNAVGNSGYAKIFDGTAVSGSVGDANWSYTGAQYWMENVNYKFVGVVNATPAAYDGQDFLTKLTVTNDADVLVSNIATRNQGAEIDATAVSLQFNHILSKIKFTFVDEAVDEYTFKVTNINIAGAKVGGTYVIDGSTWESKTDGTLVFGNATNATDENETDAQVVATGANGTTSHFVQLVVPGTYDLTISFDVELSFDGTPLKTWTEEVELDDQALLANYSYNFKAGLEPGKRIEFKVTSLTNWTDDTTVTIQ